jgi:hypothetical protein
VIMPVIILRYYLDCIDFRYEKESGHAAKIFEVRPCASSIHSYSLRNALETSVIFLTSILSQD